MKKMKKRAWKKWCKKNDPLEVRLISAASKVIYPVDLFDKILGLEHPR